MKNTMTKFISLFALASALCYGQVILSTTTLGAAVATSTATTITLASTSTMQGAGQTNQVNTFMWVDQECMAVTAVPSSTTVTVKRGGQSGCTGTGGVPRAHNSGATVWFANTTTYTGTSNNIPAGRYFTNGSTNYDIVGSTCVATTELVLPKVYTFNGRMYDCLGGAWAQTNGANTPVYGGTVASPAGVLTPTGNIMTVSGTNAITGITVPNGWAPGMVLTLIPSGNFTTTTATNIGLASTAVTAKALYMVWSGTKWNPSY
jgi:hypothetical protein